MTLRFEGEAAANEPIEQGRRRVPHHQRDLDGRVKHNLDPRLGVSVRHTWGESSKSAGVASLVQGTSRSPSPSSFNPLRPMATPLPLA